MNMFNTLIRLDDIWSILDPEHFSELDFELNRELSSQLSWELRHIGYAAMCAVDG